MSKMEKQLTQEEIKLIQMIRQVYNQTNNKDISFERVSDIMNIVDVIMDIASGKFICSECGGSKNIYVIRK